MPATILPGGYASIFTRDERRYNSFAGSGGFNAVNWMPIEENGDADRTRCNAVSQGLTQQARQRLSSRTGQSHLRSVFEDHDL